MLDIILERCRYAAARWPNIRHHHIVWPDGLPDPSMSVGVSMKIDPAIGLTSVAPDGSSQATVPCGVGRRIRRRPDGSWEAFELDVAPTYRKFISADILDAFEVFKFLEHRVRTHLNEHLRSLIHKHSKAPYEALPGHSEEYKIQTVDDVFVACLIALNQPIAKQTPRWEEKTSSLIGRNGKRRSVAPQAKKVRTILDRFEQNEWPDRMALKDDDRAEDTLKTLKKIGYDCDIEFSRDVGFACWRWI